MCVRIYLLSRSPAPNANPHLSRERTFWNITESITVNFCLYTNVPYVEPPAPQRPTWKCICETSMVPTWICHRWKNWESLLENRRRVNSISLISIFYFQKILTIIFQFFDRRRSEGCKSSQSEKKTACKNLRIVRNNLSWRVKYESSQSKHTRYRTFIWTIISIINRTVHL